MSLATPYAAPSRSFGGSRPGAERTSVWLATRITVAAVLAVLLVSAMALVALGVPYAAAGGSLLTKIHPATYIATVAVLTWAVAPGGLGRLMATTAVTHPGIAAFALATTLLFVHIAVVLRLPLSAVIDTFVLPILLFVALGAMDPAWRPRLERLLHGFFALNAMIGIVEYATGWRLTPMYDIDGSIIADWRSTALLGHPLNNAFASGCYLVILAAGGAPRLGLLPRLAAMGLSAVALVAFGGRVAMILAYVLTALLALGGLGRILAGRRFRLIDAGLAVGLATAFVVAAVVLLDAGAADRLIARFSDDAGSAGTRIAMFRIFGDLTWEEFVLGPPNDLIVQAQREFGIKIGIESTEVAFVAFYGVAVTVVVLAGLAAFLAELVRATGWAGLWPVAFFVVVMSASTGLSSKSTALALFTVMVLVLMPYDHEATSRRDP